MTDQIAAQTTSSEDGSQWPPLPYDEWRDTCTTLHLWTQVVGKIRLAKAPMINHWWQVPLYVTCRGLTTSPIPHDRCSFQIEFDFVDHRLRIDASDGRVESVRLAPQPVADFYGEVMSKLRALGLDVRIWTMPVEIPDPIRFEQDREHAVYSSEHAHRFWRVLVEVDRVLTIFRARFLGKVSPVHFFWGACDMAVTLFRSSRPATSRGAGSGIIRRTRGLFARGEQLRLLAGKWRFRPSCILFLRLPGTAELFGCAGPPKRHVLQPGSPRVHPPL